jgi:hypothetical protein
LELQAEEIKEFGECYRDIYKIKSKGNYEGAAMTALVKMPKPTQDLREAHIAAMWLMFLRAPGRETAPGEPVDLGEIGEVREFKIKRMTPYSLAVPE